MKVVLEIDHSVSKEEIQDWLDNVLIPKNHCVWGAEIKESCDGKCVEKLKDRIQLLEDENKSLSHNVVSLGNIIKQKEKLWKYLESRFVEVCKTCTPEEKAKCVMFPEYCEGECKEIVDLFALIDKGESQVVS